MDFPLSLDWTLVEVGTDIRPAIALDASDATHKAFLKKADMDPVS